jgi:hypothetical protein
VGALAEPAGIRVGLGALRLGHWTDGALRGRLDGLRPAS